MILAHEWGHHVQNLRNTPDPGGNTFELQADCLAGVFTQEASQQGLLDPGDVTEGVLISDEVADEPWWSQDSPGAHGTNDERISAFISGYTDGLSDCNLLGFGSEADPGEPAPTGQTIDVNVPAPTQVAQGPETIPASAITSALPSSMPLVHSQCFRVENDHVLNFEDLVANFGSTDEARARLQSLGWQASANRTFACDTPPEGEAGWIDISLHLFADAASAQQAVDYFAAVRAQGTSLMPGAPPAIGDHAAVLSGPATNGKEFTLYVSQGPLLVRVTGVSPTGIPFINVLTVAQSILDAPLPQALPPTPEATLPTPDVPPSPTETPSPQGLSAFLPDSLPLSHALCFRVDDEGTLDFPALIDRFSGVPDAASRLQSLGWEAGAYREFGCDEAPEGKTELIDVSVHRFPDSQSAAAAVPYFAGARAMSTGLVLAPAPSIGDSTLALSGPSGDWSDHTLYMSTGPLMFRVTGVAPSGDPAADVEQVMLGLLAGSLLVDQADGPPDAIPTQPPPTAVPTPVILPTAAPAPSPTPVPPRSGRRCHRGPKAPPWHHCHQPPRPRRCLCRPPPSWSQRRHEPSFSCGRRRRPPPRRRCRRRHLRQDGDDSPTYYGCSGFNSHRHAEALVDLLLNTPFPSELLAYGYPRTPILDEASDDEGGFTGAVEIDRAPLGPSKAPSSTIPCSPGLGRQNGNCVCGSRDSKAGLNPSMLVDLS